jgi:thioredoxin
VKYLLALIFSIGLFSAPLYAEWTEDMEKDVDVMIQLMFFSGPDKDAQIDNVINILASQVIESGEKTMEIAVLIDQVKAIMKSKEFSKGFYLFFEKNFSAEEIKRLRQIYEDETFQKFHQHSVEMTQLLLQGINQVIETVVAEDGLAKPVATPAVGEVISITADQFEKEVEQAAGFVIVDVYASWCGPCKNMKPIFDQLSQQYPGIKFVKIDYDEAKSVIKPYKVTGLPTFLFFKDGQLVGKQAGACNEDKFKGKIKEFFDL